MDSRRYFTLMMVSSRKRFSALLFFCECFSTQQEAFIVFSGAFRSTSCAEICFQTETGGHEADVSPNSSPDESGHRESDLFGKKREEKSETDISSSRK